MTRGNNHQNRRTLKKSWDYFAGIYANEFENLDEMDNFLEKFAQLGIENLDWFQYRK